MFDDRLEKVNDECGVFGIYAPGRSVSELVYLGLFSLQHRGQEACGIAVSDGDMIHHYKNLGMVTEVFNQNTLNTLDGYLAIGHVRYSASGQSKTQQNAQPIVARYQHGEIALAHNGSLINGEELRQSLMERGSLFHTTVDSEQIVALIASHGHDAMEQAMLKTMIDLKGSYSLVLMTEDTLYAVRDPLGNRPLCIGKLGDEGYVVASETCALDAIGATFLRDVAPGEIVTVDATGLHSTNMFGTDKQALCIFEFVYIARPDSNIDGINVNKARRLMGRELAKEAKLDVDIVISVPDSGTTAAIGYAEESGIPFTQGILKNRYTGRSFIQPTQEMREQMVKLKLNPIRDALEGKRVAVVDDSIVRGTTSRKLVKLLREYGAKEVHMLISCPPVKYPCFYGVDTGNPEELIAAKLDVDGICEHIGADSLHYISMEGILRAVEWSGVGFCTACVSGEYPLGVPCNHCKKSK
ncbi:MAG: amidophosphoribosyltransferase [Peptococcaceae bacterium]|nr:amidophosphoribosyltransferase [Peptococcaceae bacterium]